MKRRLLISLSMLAVISLIACSNVGVKTDFDPDIDFTSYKTYDWLNIDSRQGESTYANVELVDQRIKRAVDEQLTDFGYIHADNGQPDFLVAYYTITNDKERAADYGYRYFGHSHRVNDVQVYQYDQGTLIIDIVDTKLNQLIWRGWASQSLDNINPTEDQIQKAVSQILGQFPPEGENRP
jgi:hypothetical protein